VAAARTPSVSDTHALEVDHPLNFKYKLVATLSLAQTKDKKLSMDIMDMLTALIQKPSVMVLARSTAQETVWEEVPV